MERSCSADLRVRNFGTCVGGSFAARQSGVSVSCPITLVQRVEKPASAAAVRRDRPRGAAKLASHLPLLIGWVEAQRDIGMPELAARLNAEKKG